MWGPPGTELPSGCDTQWHLCVTAACTRLPDEGGAHAQGGPEGSVVPPPHPHPSSQRGCCLSAGKRVKINKCIVRLSTAWIFPPVSVPSFLVLQSLFPLSFYGIFMCIYIEDPHMKSGVSIVFADAYGCAILWGSMMRYGVLIPFALT